MSNKITSDNIMRKTCVKFQGGYREGTCGLAAIYNCSWSSYDIDKDISIATGVGRSGTYFRRERQIQHQSTVAYWKIT